MDLSGRREGLFAVEDILVISVFLNSQYLNGLKVSLLINKKIGRIYSSNC